VGPRELANEFGEAGACISGVPVLSYLRCILDVRHGIENRLMRQSWWELAHP
jgi:hypothetical protein